MTRPDSDDLIALRWMRSILQSGEAKAIRIASNISQIEMAVAVGSSAAAISRWERGQRVPRGEAALRYSRFLLDLQETQESLPMSPFIDPRARSGRVRHQIALARKYTLRDAHHPENWAPDAVSWITSLRMAA